MRTKFLLPLFLGVAFLATGCSFEPRYRRPSVETAGGYKEQASPSTATVETSSSTAGVQWLAGHPIDALPRGNWWELFGDARLNELEKKIAVSNQSVKQAEAQYRQAGALVAFGRASYFPTVTTQPSATRSFGPPNGANGASHTAASNNFTLPVTASWEPNLWGVIGLSVKNAAASAQASAADLENMRLSMQAELAVDYFTLEATDMEVGLLNRATADFDKALQLTITRYNGGVSSKADVAQAQTQLDSTRAQSTDLSITRAQLEHAIAVLVGQSPSTFSLSTGAIQGLPPVIPAGLPSQLLERRPDIAASERLVAAANANIGLARAAYFPILSLTVTAGYESATSSEWLTWPSRFWSIGAAAAETLLDFGRRGARRRQAHAAYDETVAVYRQTVLGAFQEVEDNLTAQRLLGEEGAQQESAVTSAEESLNLEMARYRAGIVSFLDIITTQNIALTNERSAAHVLGRRMVAAVALIRTLGGGWDVSQLPTARDVSRAK